jgi:hypothetical protein
VTVIHINPLCSDYKAAKAKKAVPRGGASGDEARRATARAEGDGLPALSPSSFGGAPRPGRGGRRFNPATPTNEIIT